MAYPSIDAEHIDPPYLPDKPINIMSRGDYAKDLDIMIGNFLRVESYENETYNFQRLYFTGFVEDESLIGTQIFLPGMRTETPIINF